MTDHPSPNEPHKKLIDGLTALVLADQMDKHEALKIIAYYNRVHPEASWLDESVLAQIRSTYAPVTERELRYRMQSTEELETRLGEIQYHLLPIRLPFLSFGDHVRQQKLSVEADYIEDELGRRS